MDGSPAQRSQTNDERARTASARRFAYLYAIAATVAAGMVALAAWMLWDAHNVARDDALHYTTSVTAAVEHDIQRNIELYDLSLKAAVDGLKVKDIWSLSPETRNRLLFDGAVSAHFLGGILITDEHGDVVASSNFVTPPKINLADREYFKAHEGNARLGLYISGPIKGLLTNRWSLALSRRVDNADGSFAGVVSGVIGLDYFRELFDQVDTGPNATIGLYRTNKTIMIRKPYRDADIGSDISNNGLWRHFPESPADSYEAIANSDGVPRFYSYRQVGNLPLIVSVGASQDLAFSAWRRKAIVVSLITAWMIAAAAGFGWRSFADFRQRGRAEQRAIESEQRYRLLAEYSTDLITLSEPDGTRLYASPASRSVYGYEPAEIVGRRTEDFVHPDDRHIVTEAFAQIMTGATRATTLARGLRKDGGYVWLEANMQRTADPVTGESEIVSVVRDISARKAVEEELEAAKDRAEAANRTKSAFLANMSHELRTPLNAVIGFSDLIERENFGPLGDPRYREYAQDIRMSGQHLLDMINEILDHAKAEAGHLELEEDKVDIGAVTDFALRMLAPRAERAGVALTVFSPAEIVLAGDERRLKQVMLNLLANAIKFTPSGGRVTVTAAIEATGDLMISVEDTGIGIAEDDQARVFEPFLQARDSTISEKEGTGLGLPLTKRLVELHGGTLELRSVRGTGTTVVVRLPAWRVTAPVIAGGAVSLRDATVLLVDDDQEVRAMTLEMLNNMGVTTLAAAGANEALMHLQRTPRIDLLLSDVVMPPGMNGTELADRAASMHPGMKVLLMTGFAGQILGRDGEGGSRYPLLRKPFTADELKRKMEDVLDISDNVLAMDRRGAGRNTA